MPGSEYYDCPCGCGNHIDNCRKKRKADHNPNSTYKCKSCGADRNGYENHHCAPKPCRHQWSLDVESGLLFCRHCGIEKPTTITKPGKAIYVCDRHREPLKPNKPKGICVICKDEMRRGRIHIYTTYVDTTNKRIQEVQAELNRLRALKKQQVKDLEDLKNEKP